MDSNIVTTNEERLIAGIVHWSMLASLLLVTFWVPWLISAVVYFVFKGRSKFLGFQALQALVFQVSVILIGGILCIIGAPLVEVLIGIPMVLVGVIIILGGYILSAVAGIACFQGKFYRYPIVGNWFKA